MPRVPFIVPRGLSREESADWLLAAITAAREAAGHGGAPELAENAELEAARPDTAIGNAPEAPQPGRDEP